MLVSIIPETQKVEIWRTEVQIQPRQKDSKTSHLNKKAGNGDEHL
jgi:hypothetical protein